MTTLTAIGLLMGLLAAMIVYLVWAPKSSRRFQPDNQEQAANNPMLKFVAAIGNDLYGAMPEAFDRQNMRREHPRVESLLTRSGNPWNLTASEFVAFRYIAGFLGIILGSVLWLLTSGFIPLPWFVTIPAVALFCFFIPTLKYNAQAKQRDIEFKRQLPEALDLMTISLSGGSTFGQSLREVVPNMEEGILKVEFQNIVHRLNAGETLKSALDNFAERAPNDGVLTFVRSVQSATEVNAPLAEILESRAQASREEFFAMIHEKTAMLESKMWMVLSPTLLPAVIIISCAPSVASMATSFAS